MTRPTVPRPLRPVRLPGRHQRAARIQQLVLVLPSARPPCRATGRRRRPASRASASGSVSGSAGTMSNMTPSGRTSRPCRKIEEQIGLLRRLWTERYLSFEGRFDRIDRAAINPRPKRQIPIWLAAGRSPPMSAVRASPTASSSRRPRRRLEELARVTHHLRQRPPIDSFAASCSPFFTRDVEDTAASSTPGAARAGTHGCVCTQDRASAPMFDAHIDSHRAVRERPSARPKASRCKCDPSS